MASTETLPATPSNPAGPSAAAPRGAAPPEFPGCKPVHLPRAEIERFEGRLEYWEAATETAWICEPTTPYHERPARLLTPRRHLAIRSVTATPFAIPPRISRNRSNAPAGTAVMLP